MKKYYGIFMNNGASVRYGDMGGSGLVKLGTQDFNSEKEAIEFINSSGHVQSNSEYYIFEFVKYTKPFQNS